uniref:NADH dehydrogenase subunit 3 n=1 Tax=Rhodella violacea TaxID=2801 RepID=UPI001FCD873E|nr:NADH dehydrogenase subunit 3 [Rhodella violacea]UNJ19093.1 NADH dehydrogenase subunit 3 [Rhodella violacea]
MFLINFNLVEYGSILVYFLLSTVISIILIVLSYILAVQKVDHEKITTYECGFNPFEDARSTFDVRFYLVAILFLVFDLEISFLFPWVMALGNCHVFGYWSMMHFLKLLTIGFIYEWYKGALEWE